jgi:hypothetical protein
MYFLHLAARNLKVKINLSKTSQLSNMIQMSMYVSVDYTSKFASPLILIRYTWFFT